MEIASISALLISIGALCALVMDKMRNSKCTRVLCCNGCFEIDRDLDNHDNEKSESNSKL